MEIRALDPVTLSASQRASLAALGQEKCAEDDPGDPVPPVESVLAYFDVTGADAPRSYWGAWQGDDLLALAEYTVSPQDTAEVFVFTRRAHRRAGLATRLLAPLLERARRDGREVLWFYTVDEIEGGRSFAERLGATATQGEEIAELNLRTIDLAALRAEEVALAARAAAFELVFYDAFPGEHAEALAALTDVVWGSPAGSTTADALRDECRAEAERGAARWVLLARERCSGRIAGFIQASWDVATPSHVAIDFAGVHPDNRRGGLLSFLTDSLVRRLVERGTFSAVRYRTGHDNVPVLARGRAMRFEPYQTYWTWRIETARALPSARP